MESKTCTVEILSHLPTHICAYLTLFIVERCLDDGNIRIPNQRGAIDVSLSRVGRVALQTISELVGCAWRFTEYYAGGIEISLSQSHLLVLLSEI